MCVCVSVCFLQLLFSFIFARAFFQLAYKCMRLSARAFGWISLFFFVFISFCLFSFHQLNCFQWKKKCTCMTFNASITMIETFDVVVVVVESFHFFVLFGLALHCSFGFLFFLLTLNSLVQFSARLQNHTNTRKHTQRDTDKTLCCFWSERALVWSFDHFSSILTDTHREKKRMTTCVFEWRNQTYT